MRLNLPLALLGTVAAVSLAQQPPAGMARINVDRSRQMLKDAYTELKKHYYDTKFHGLDIDARFKDFDAQMTRATSLSQGFCIVAAFLDGLNDSHTFFRPPSRPFRNDYGFRIQMFGDKPLISRVRPGTDAETKVHPGDEVLAWNTFSIGRNELWKINYFFNNISPQDVSRLALREVEIQPYRQQQKRVLDIAGHNGDSDIFQLIREEENADHLVRQRYSESEGAMIWKMPEFDMDDDQPEASGCENPRRQCVLWPSLRSGGYRLRLGCRVVCTRGALEKRGTVIGDTSSGSVMEARGYSESQGTDTKIFYSFSVTDADLIMRDGKSLEHHGVVPDEVVVPTALDLAEGRDPAMVRAARLAGIRLDPAAAGDIFPFEWIKL